MKLSDILLVPDAKLFEKSNLISRIDDHLKNTMTDMVDFILQYDANGLSAPQIGINKTFFVTRFEPYYFINPAIIKISGKKVYQIEGCLSIPSVYINVPRFTKITLEYYDFDGKLYKKEYQDMQARIIQHENDHLYGKLITNYA